MTDDERAALESAGYRVGDADGFVREVLSGDEAADMPPWIVEKFSAGPIYVEVYSDGSVTFEQYLDLPRDEAIAMCNHILAIMEGGPA